MTEVTTATHNICLRVYEDVLHGGHPIDDARCMNFAPSKLFHAVVIAGAALTGCANNAHKPKSPGDTAAAVNTPGAPGQPASSGGTCPPGSERPFPPCYWIL